MIRSGSRMRLAPPRAVCLTLALGLGLAAAGCGKKSAPSEAPRRSYTLYWSVQKQPEGGVKLSLAVPPSWKEELDPMASPSFTVPEIGSPLPAVSVVAVSCPPAGDCLERTVGLQYGADELAAAKRENLADGRLWIEHDAKLASAGGRRRVHARLFALHPASKSVVMCVVRLMDAAGDRLPEMRKTCESLAF